MNKRITLNHITLAGCCLLFAATQALADRPAMSERSESFEPELIEIPPALEVTTTDETAAEKISEVEASAQPEPAAEAEPVIKVYDHRTETEITGDVIELQSGDALPVRMLDFPRRGMSMDKVKNELGEPLEVSAAVGEPPITRWTYSDRVVYFEYSSVLHVVATR